MKFYTWCNNSKSDKIQRLLDSAKLQNIDVDTIGEGRDVHKGGNLNGKNLWLYEKVCELDENEIVVCTDSFDVIYLTNADEIKQKFLKMNAKIVYSTECLYNHQDPHYLEYYKKMGKGKHYKFLNSGALIGYAKNIKEILEVILNPKHQSSQSSLMSIMGEINDQTWVGKYIAENSNKVKLDYDCEIFLTDINFCLRCPQKHSHPKWIRYAISELKNKILVNGRMLSPFTNTNPCIYHCPNPKKTSAIISTAWDYIKTTK
jgi:hypothetical protein